MGDGACVWGEVGGKLSERTRAHNIQYELSQGYR